MWPSDAHTVIEWESFHGGANRTCTHQEGSESLWKTENDDEQENDDEKKTRDTLAQTGKEIQEEKKNMRTRNNIEASQIDIVSDISQIEQSATDQEDTW